MDPGLYITYPCEELPAATSAIVCFLTAGVEEGDKEEGEDEGVEEGMSGGPEASQQTDLWSEDEKE